MLAGQKTYLGMHLNQPITTTRTYKDSNIAIAPLSCTIKDDRNSSYELFSYDSDSCGNGNVGFAIDYNGSIWQIEHILFLFSYPDDRSPTKNNQILSCDVVTCSKVDFDSVCNDMARKCLSEEKALLYIAGYDQNSLILGKPDLEENNSFLHEINHTQSEDDNVSSSYETTSTTDSTAYCNYTICVHDPLTYGPWKGPETESVYMLTGLQSPGGKAAVLEYLTELDSMDDNPLGDNTDRKRRSTASIPENYDLRNDPDCGAMVDVVRNQQNCGNCWAFASIGVIQDVTCLSSKGRFKHLQTFRH